MAKPDQGKPEAKKEKEPKGTPQKGGEGKAPKGADAKAPKGGDAKGAPKGPQKPAKPAKPAAPPRLKERYQKDILPTMMREFGYGNLMQAPRIQKVVINIGVGEAIANAKALDGAVKDMTAITGQKPLVKKAKKSIATFKLREGMPIGVKTTLRGDRMYYFLDRLMNIALPRTRDFRGVPRDAFDGRGNYTLGLREQLIWPEIDYDQIDKVRGMEVSIVTSARNDEEARRMLQLFGMPFRAQ
jgi:large subunit ribosomal protein L5